MVAVNTSLVEPIRSNRQNGQRELPASETAEEGLIASVWIDFKDVLPRAIMEDIKASSFFNTAYATIWQVMLDIYAQNRPVTVDVTAEELMARGKLMEVGHHSTLVYISKRVPTTMEALDFIKTVKAYATRRAIILECRASAMQAYDHSGPIDELVADVQTRVARATAAESTQEDTVAETAESILQDLKFPQNQRKGQGTAAWGLPSIDRICGKMAPGDLVILAGAPSTGKSCVGTQSAWVNAKAGLNVALFSYEMSKQKLLIRMAQQISRLNIKQFDGAPRDQQLAFVAAVRELKECPHLFIFERDNTLAKVCARVRAMHQRKAVGQIVVDFIQYLARLEPRIDKESMVEKIGRITATLKALGREVGAPVLLLSSLNRDGYREGNAPPNMSNLKASGEIESDADMVDILHWPKDNPFTGAAQDPHDPDTNSFYCELLQDKGRDTGVHKVPLMFTRNATRFDCCTH